MKLQHKRTIREQLPVVIGIIILTVLILLPTGYEEAVIYQGSDRAVGQVTEVNNKMLINTGLVKSGEQVCTILLKSGRFKGQIVDGINMLNGTLEQDKIFSVGDSALVVISYDNNTINSVNMIDHYRINKELITAGLLVVLLILFAGKTGLRTILSFAVTIMMIWKILIPSYLKGYNPIIMGLLIALLLTVIIITLVMGLNRCSVAAIAGATLGTLMTAVLGVVFTDLYKIHGAVMPYSESLLYSGYSQLSLTKIYISCIFIGSAGAIMDLAVDITAAINEVVETNTEITWKEATLSGINVGKAAIGTQTATLLLAYSGGYIALLMVFMAQGTPIDNILNYKYVSSEILDTIIGSIGLVTVAPFTAVICGFLLTRKKYVR